ncbi:MAG: L-threonylcarbamoyladenylate synthase [Cryomorphaceae bacterium]|nr:threonylcarbamoyl-AMP synthase [Flavobacteriales bacterium]
MQTTVGTDIQKAREFLNSGELVAIPTETVYGLAANGLDPVAVSKIFEAKNRPSFDPLILHIGNLDMLEKLTVSVPQVALDLAAVFWPGPLTLILSKSEDVPHIVTSGLGSVGVRMPNHPATIELLRSLSFPLAAPSANLFGYVSPTTALHVVKQMDTKIPYVLDGGPCDVGVESTIVDLTGHHAVLLRKGGIAPEEIARITGKLEIQTSGTSNPKAPGMLTSHYSPGKPFIVGNPKEIAEKYKSEKIGVLGFTSTWGFEGKVLSASGNLREAAKNLFAHMRELDDSDCDVIIAETVPDEGLGMAINDRLRRASS